MNLEVLDSRPAVVVSYSQSIAEELASFSGSIDEEYPCYFTTFQAEMGLIRQADQAITRGHQLLMMLYMYRSIARAIPEISLAEFATEDLTIDEKAELMEKTNEINQKLIDILRPEIGNITELMNYTVQTINLFHLLLNHGIKNKDSIPEDFLMIIIEVLDALMSVSLIHNSVQQCLTISIFHLYM